MAVAPGGGGNLLDGDKAGGGGACNGKPIVVLAADGAAGSVASDCVVAISFRNACGGVKAFSNGSLVGLATPGGEAYWREGRETGFACDT